LHAVGAAHREALVAFLAAGVVGVADHAHAGGGGALQAIGDLVEHLRQVALDVGAAGVERQLVGNHEVQLVVGRLLDHHARALGGGFQVGLQRRQPRGPAVGGRSLGLGGGRGPVGRRRGRLRSATGDEQQHGRGRARNNELPHEYSLE